MPSNNRLYFAVTQLSFAQLGSNTFTAAHGVQSVGLTTNFNLTNINQLGELQIYESIEDIPDIELTAEKVLDGYPPLICLATRGAASPSLAGRQNVRCSPAISYFSDVQDSASGTPISAVVNSGMYWSSTTFTFPVDGPYTESFTAVGNNKVWSYSNITATGLFYNNDQPIAYFGGSGGVNRREDMIFYPVGTLPQETGNFAFDENGMVNKFLTILPPDVDGISSSGVNNFSGDVFGAHVGTITVSVNLGRESINEQGRKGPYYRFPTFPVEVTTEIESIGIRGDGVTATEAGTQTGNDAGNNLVNRTIKIRCREGLWLDLGTRNKLQSTNISGGDTGGGNVTIRYSFLNYNTLKITHPRDPSGFTWPY